MKGIRHTLVPLALAICSSPAIAGQVPQPAPVTDSDFYDPGPTAAAKVESEIRPRLVDAAHDAGFVPPSTGP